MAWWSLRSTWVIALGLAFSAGVARAGGGRLQVLPGELSLTAADRQHGIVVSFTDATGKTRDVTGVSKISSVNPGVAAVDGPQVKAVGEGAADILVEHEGLTARVGVTVSGLSTPAAPSFRQDVLPVLTRTGCNMGGCHGKLNGQNGFRLSLRGYAPEWDYDWLTSEVRSRRIEYADPAASLMVLKPAGLAPHEGGKRFDGDSRYAKVLIDWIANRTPAPDPAESDAVRLEVLPGGRTLAAGESQQLLVRAHYPDGRVRDVTWLAQFHSNEPVTMAVNEQGLVKSLRVGEAAVRVHFQGQVEVVLFTTPHATAVSAEAFARRNNVVDEHVFAKLESLRIPPSPDADDAAFLRRAHLDTIGTLPTPEEVRAFLTSTDPRKRAKLVDALLDRPEWVDYWSLQLGDILQNRKERDHDVRGAKNVRLFHAWLRDQVAQNRGWDAIARDVLLATGDSTTSPQVGYFVVTVGEKGKAEESELPDSIAQSFLGTRIGCAKCHNHPLEKYTQDDYYHFAAFFSKLSLKRSSPDKGPTRLAMTSKEELEQRKQIESRENELAAAEKEAEGKTDKELKKAQDKVAEKRKQLAQANEQLAKIRSAMPTVRQPRTGQAMAARPLDRTPLPIAPGEDPRATLVNWMLDPKNESFAGAMVNRLWRHFMGVGMIEPVDDIRSSNPPSNPALWAALNAEFVAKRYDLKHMMRLILNSRAYQLASSTVEGNETDARFYSHHYARRLPAEVLMDAMSAAADVPDSFAGYPVGVRAIQLPEPGVSSYFLQIFGRSDRVTACACERNGDVTLPQLLHLQNSPELLAKLKNPEGRLAKLLARKDLSTDQLIEEIFLSTVSRPPRPAEARAVRSAMSGDPKEDVLRDLYWALFNAKEFSFNH